MNTIASLLAAVSPALASDVSFNGTIVELESAGCAGAQFGIEGTGVHLEGGGLFEPFVGQTLLVRGTATFVDGCDAGVLLAVDSLSAPTATLESCGSSGVGCPLRFRVGPDEPGVDLLVAGAGGPFFGPVGELGVLFAAPPLVALGVATGGAAIELQVPNALELIGLEVHFQALHVSGATAALSNPLQTLIAPHGPFCLDLGQCAF